METLQEMHLKKIISTTDSEFHYEKEKKRADNQTERKITIFFIICFPVHADVVTDNETLTSINVKLPLFSEICQRVAHYHVPDC